MRGRVPGPVAAPAGLIAMWDGDPSNTPDGWDLCDGSGGTPNLLDRSPKGTDTESNFGNTGGSDGATSGTHGHGQSSQVTFGKAGPDSINVVDGINDQGQLNITTIPKSMRMAFVRSSGTNNVTDIITFSDIASSSLPSKLTDYTAMNGYTPRGVPDTTTAPGTTLGSDTQNLGHGHGVNYYGAGVEDTQSEEVTVYKQLDNNGTDVNIVPSTIYYNAVKISSVAGMEPGEIYLWADALSDLPEVCNIMAGMSGYQVRASNSDSDIGNSFGGAENGISWTHSHTLSSSDLMPPTAEYNKTTTASVGDGTISFGGADAESKHTELGFVKVT